MLAEKGDQNVHTYILTHTHIHTNIHSYIHTAYLGVFSYGWNIKILSRTSCWSYSTLFCILARSWEGNEIHWLYGVTFNTHGNTNGSVNPSHSTQCKMLTSRPTQMLAMMLHFLKMCVLLDQIMFVIVKNRNMLGMWCLTISLFQFTDLYHSYQLFY